MSCQFKKCQESAKKICESCKDSKFLCLDHEKVHSKIYENHLIHDINEDLSKSLKKTLIKSKFENCILTITEEAEALISMIKKISSDSIKLLKILNKNIQEISAFTPHLSFKERLSSLKENAKKIIQELQEEMNHFLESKDELSSKSHNENKDLRTFSLSELKSDFNQMDLSRKFEYIIKNFEFIPNWSEPQGLHVTNDGKYLFYCKLNSGTSNSDCILHKGRKSNKVDCKKKCADVSIEDSVSKTSRRYHQCIKNRL